MNVEQNIHNTLYTPSACTTWAGALSCSTPDTRYCRLRHLDHTTTAFVSPDLAPTSSPDLTPVDNKLI